MHRLTVQSIWQCLLPCLFLTACARPIAAPQPQVFRNPQAPIYSSAVLTPQRLAGHWVQVAGFGPGGVLPCGPGFVDIADGKVTWRLCLDTERSGSGPIVPGKPGRFAVTGLADLWVLWVDGDDRTLVIGTPSGQFGFVLNRQAGLPPDRLRAVRDILTFNGYDLAAFRAF